MLAVVHMQPHLVDTRSHDKITLKQLRQLFHAHSRNRRAHERRGLHPPPSCRRDSRNLRWKAGEEYQSAMLGNLLIFSDEDSTLSEGKQAWRSRGITSGGHHNLRRLKRFVAAKKSFRKRDTNRAAAAVEIEELEEKEWRQMCLIRGEDLGPSTPFHMLADSFLCTFTTANTHRIPILIPFRRFG